MGNIGNENYNGKKKAMSFKEAMIAAKLAGFKFPFVIAAQFALETGYGTAQASAKNNFFNIKWNDAAAAKLKADGINVIKGTKKVKDSATGEEDYYMSFETPQDAFRGLKTFLDVNPRYSKAGLDDAETEEEYIQALQKAGYAQDKNYLSKITSIISQARNEDITLLTPEDEAKLNPEYINSEIIKTELQKKKKKPSDVILEQQVKEANSKFAILKNAQKEYNNAIGSGEIELIDKTKKAYEEAYADAKDLVGPLSEKALQQEKERLLEKQKRFTPTSDKGIQISESLKNIDLAIKENSKTVLPNKLNLSNQDIIQSSVSVGIPGGGSAPPLEVKVKPADLQIMEIERLTQRVNLNTANTLRPSNFEVKDEEVLKIQNERLKEKAVVEEKQQKFNEEYNDAVIANINEKEGIDNQEKLRLQALALKEAEDAQKAIDDANAYKTYQAEAENFMSRFDAPPEFIEPDQFVYDKKDYKRQLPFEALGYGLLGLQGLSDAKTPLPMRDEQVSQALLQYTADLKHMSEQGLKPEEEAKLKDQLSGVYSQGLDQLVRASGGDRNVVLGNMQGLQNAKMRGLTDMAIADVNIKQQNFEKYGEAIKELNAFRMTKDIANHSIKLEEAKNKRQGGAALASSGFASMLEEIQYQKENGPGSANHRLNKAFEIQLTGVDSERPDDGRPFTPTYNKNKAFQGQMARQNIMDQYEKNAKYYEGYKSLSQEEALKIGNIYNYIQQQEQPQAQSNQSSNYGGFGW